MAKQRKVDEKFLIERYNKDVAYFSIYDSYTRNYKREIVTGKFYSKYEHLDLSKADPIMLDEIKTVKDKLPSERYEWPVVESHRYGWFQPLLYLDRTDGRFYFPLKMPEFTRHEISLRADKAMHKPKFTGIPFKL